MTRYIAAGACALVLLTGIAAPVRGQAAQAARTFRVRLSPMPVDGPQMMATIAGSGAVTATLTGNRLTLTGSFEGLKSPATQLKIHRGIRGVRGPAVADLGAPPGAASGTLSATIELSATQVDDLGKARLYLQLYSEKAPEGNLWGWLLPQDPKAQEIRK